MSDQQPVALGREYIDILRHMVGADSKQPGYRNHFCAEIGHSDHRKLCYLDKTGFVFAGRTINAGRDRYFHCTELGCRVAGMTDAQISAMDES